MGCGACRGSRAILDGVIRVGAFRGELASLIRGLKYGGRWELAGPLGRLLAGRLRERFHVLGIPLECPGDWRVIPMPMPRWRRRYRGLDHAQLLAEAVAHHLGMPIIRPLRKRGGVPQATLSRSLRGRSPRADYRVVRQGVRGFGGRMPNLGGLNVILVDDVLTTGRSMCAAGSLLRRLCPARIMAVALAVTEQREQPEGALLGRGSYS
ncbi:MAG: phosphoribosyltransferase family protein [Planctomycetota bacterium]|nr:phosphoribosyltransferase family protein [Planctomycetota bacterium]